MQRLQNVLCYGKLKGATHTNILWWNATTQDEHLTQQPLAHSTWEDLVAWARSTATHLTPIQIEVIRK